jgi:hypothetical protein
MGHLESLKAIAGLSLLTDNIKHRVNQLSSLSVVTLGPIVTSTSLTKHEVIRAEKLSKRSSTDRVHGSRLEVHEDGTGHVSSSGGLIVVHVDSLQLKVGISMVSSSGINAMLIGDNLPKLGTNLVTALTCLNVDDFSHISYKLK